MDWNLWKWCKAHDLVLQGMSGLPKNYMCEKRLVTPTIALVQLFILLTIISQPHTRRMPNYVLYFIAQASQATHTHTTIHYTTTLHYHTLHYTLHTTLHTSNFTLYTALHTALHTVLHTTRHTTRHDTRHTTHHTRHTTHHTTHHTPHTTHHTCH